jgi:hypothetical protein
MNLHMTKEEPEGRHRYDHIFEKLRPIVQTHVRLEMAETDLIRPIFRKPRSFFAAGGRLNHLVRDH